MIVMLDRDGTINIDHGYVFTRERLELIPGAAMAIGDLNRAQCRCVVVSNQSAVARGMCTMGQVEETNRHLEALLKGVDTDAKIESFRYSPDGPDSNSMTRKPETGMVTDFLRQSETLLMVGDKYSDIEFGVNCGAYMNFLVLTGSGKDSSNKVQADFPDTVIVSDLIEASKIILELNE